MGTLWGGRFNKGENPELAAFDSSFGFDIRFLTDDIKGSIAHATMLGEKGILARDEAETIVQGLRELLAEAEKGVLALDPKSEDVHSAVETELVRRIGEPGKRLHTGRSRNDQVALDARLWSRRTIDEIRGLILEFIRTLVDLVEKNTRTVMPGYTHLQRAQPITLAFHLCAYIEMLKRDLSRLTDCRKRLDVSPLGSGALAATTYPLDRARTAELLGFQGITANALDAVSDRDFVAELIFCLSLVMAHLSRFAEEIVLWSSAEFGFIELDDGFSTGSSIMPQKKNPDAAELVRGKTGRVYGDLIAILTTLKGLPLAYGKDLQEDKEALFDATDTVKASLRVFSPMLATMTVKKEAMAEAARGGFTNATDAADYLAKKGVPFRDAHKILGSLVSYCIEKKKNLETLSLDEYRSFSDVFGQDIYAAVSVEACVEGRSVPGGPATATIEKYIDSLKTTLFT
jgi:argininosuccinate lyase